MLTIAATSLQTGPAIVTQLHVRQGDLVAQGDVLATLAGNEEMTAALAASERRIEVAKARVVAMLSGGKREDVRAVQAEIESEEANLAHIEADTRRAKQLHDERMLSAAAMEAQQSRLAGNGSYGFDD